MKDCPVCGNPIEKHLVICESCEYGYDSLPTIEKRPKEHVIDGNSWWRISRKKVQKGA